MKKVVFLTVILITLVSVSGFGQNGKKEFNRGLAYYDQGMYGKAIDAFTNALGFEPNKAEYYSARAQAYEKLSKFSEAKADYEKALVFEPKNVIAIANLPLVNKKISNLVLAEYGYSSPLINTILKSCNESKVNLNYETLYKNTETNSLTYSTNTNSSQKISGFLGDQEISLSSVSDFSLVTEFIKYLSANSQSEKEKCFANLFDYVYYGATPSDYLGKAPNDSPKSIITESWPKKFIYTYVKELGLFIVEWPSKYDESIKHFYMFDPIYGPIQFVLDPNGFKLFENQRLSVRLDVIKDNYIIRQQDPNQQYSYYSIPDKYYVINPSGSDNSGYDFWVRSDGYSEVESWEMPRFGYTSITADQSGNYKIGQNYYIEQGTKEYKYYPTYDEKIHIFQAGGISNADVKNPNYYYLKKETDRKIYYYSLLNYNGYKLLPFSYSEINSLGNNLFVTKVNDKYGLIKVTPLSLRSGKFRVLDNVFDEIVDNKDGTLKVNLVGNSFNIDLNGNILH